MAILPPDPLFCLRSDMGYIHNMCFIPNESVTTNLLAATESGFVYLWDLQTNRVRSKQNLGSSIQAIHCTGESVITQEKAGVVKLWKIQNETHYEFSKSYEWSGGYCRCIIVDNMLVIPKANSTIEIVDLKTLKAVRTFSPLSENLGVVMCLQKVELSDKVYILAGYETGDIILWDFLTSKACNKLQLREGTTSLTFDSANGRGVCGNSSEQLEVFTIDRNLVMDLKCEISIVNEGCSIVKLRPDRKIFVSGGWNGRIRIYSWRSLRLLVVLNEHKKTVTDIQFSPNIVPAWNSNIMAVSGGDGVISLWNLYN